MLRILLKKQLAEIFRSYFYDPKKNKSRSKASVIGYAVMFAVIMLGFLGGIFTMLSMSLCQPLVSVGMGWLYFALMGLLAIVLGVFGSVFNTYAGLYLAKDNDLLLSLPIPVGTIIGSRILGVYIMGLMYSGVVIIPAAVVYMIQAAETVSEFFGPVLLTVLITVLVLILSCLLGWVVAKLSVKLKNKSFITVILSLLFIAVYYVVYYHAGNLIGDMIANAAEYGSRIKGAAYPIYVFGNAGVGEPLSMLIITAFTAVLVLIMWLLISKSFIRLVTLSGETVKKVYRVPKSEKRSVDAALFSKELARFTSSSSYMLNCGLGTVLLFALGVFLLIKGREYFDMLGQMLGELSSAVSVALTAIVCFVASMNDISAPSVSLEGKSVWLAQSLPITAWQVIRAKLAVHLLVTGVPTAFCVACGFAAGRLNAVEALLSLLLSLQFVVFTAFGGMTAGLKMSNIHWTSEITPIKQSGAVFLSLFGGMIYAGVFVGIYFAVYGYIGSIVYMAAASLLTAGVSLALYMWIKKTGTRIFAAL